MKKSKVQASIKFGLIPIFVNNGRGVLKLQLIELTLLAAI